MCRAKRLFIIFAFISLVCLPAATLTLKIATLAPTGSPWVESLRRLAAKWDRISAGRVRVKIYAGGVAGEEADMIRKMRIGQLQGAALTQMGLSLLDPAILALSVPFLIRNEAQLDHVMERTKPYFQSRLRDRGYHLITFSKVGWVHFFGRTALVYPEDLMRLKLGVPAGDAEFVNTWRKVGFNAFSLPFGDLLAGLQSGMIDAFYAPPLVAASFQWFGPARHMSALPIAPVIGAVLVSERFIEQIPAELRDPLLKTFVELEIELNRGMQSLESEALAAMKAQGLEIHPVPPDAAAQWQALGNRGVEAVLNKSFPEQSYRLIVDSLAELHDHSPP